MNNKLPSIKLNVTMENYKEVESIINKLHTLNITSFLNNKSLTIVNINIYNHENIAKSIDELYKINAIKITDWSLINLHLESIKLCV